MPGDRALVVLLLFSAPRISEGRVREWLGADGAPDGDALDDSFARNYAVRDFKRRLKLERRWSPASVNLALAAVDHFFRFVGLGAAEVSRRRRLLRWGLHDGGRLRARYDLAAQQL